MKKVPYIIVIFLLVGVYLSTVILFGKDEVTDIITTILAIVAAQLPDLLFVFSDIVIHAPPGHGIIYLRLVLHSQQPQKRLISAQHKQVSLLHAGAIPDQRNICPVASLSRIPTIQQLHVIWPNNLPALKTATVEQIRESVLVAQIVV